MTERATSCSFTGHRPIKLPWKNDESDERCVELKKKLYDIAEAVYLSGVRHFLCGMAQGSDLYFCETIIELRNRYPDVTLEAVIPCETQAAKWREQDRERYFRLVAQCDTETMLQREYTPDCMSKRNKYLVDHASVIIAVYDGTFGGTMQTIMYARQQDLEIIQIRP
ncbi:MAG: DUF1273 family protein [Oscillospiraceae bacterium]|nr:DUF1273 family protein [Oscillospiraceae bacterium]